MAKKPGLRTIGIMRAALVTMTIAAGLASSCGGGGSGPIGGPPPVPIASISPVTVAFGNQNVATTSAVKTVALSNTGTAALVISSIAVTGANASDFPATNNCGASLAPEANCAISVMFKPAAAGARSASIAVTDNAAGSPQMVGLSGTGVNPAPTATLAAAPATINQGGTVTLTVTTTNATTCAASANPADSAWSGNVACNGPVTITPAATGTVTYSVAATGAGGTANASATVTVNPTTITSVVVSPATATVVTLGTKAFSVTVSGTGSYNPAVAWTASAGTISSSGVFTAPGTPGTVTVTATSLQDQTKSGSATVAVVAPPTATLTASPTTIALGQSSTLSWATTNATGCSASGAWSGTEPCSGSQAVTPASTGTFTYTLTATGPGGTISVSATVTVVLQLTASVSPATASINTAQTANFAVTVMNGAGNATVSWSASPSVGTLSPASGLTTTYAPPATLTTSPMTVTVTATVTDASGTATATAKITITRVITIAFIETTSTTTSPQTTNIPNNEIYSDFGTLTLVGVTCTGCESGDVLSITGSGWASGYGTQTYSYTPPWGIVMNSTGIAYVPGTRKFQVSGTDSVQSNVLWLTFDGGANVVDEDPSSGAIHYIYTGNGTQGSALVLNYKQDGTTTGSFQGGGFGIAADNLTHDVVIAGAGGISICSSTGINFGGVCLPNNASCNYSGSYYVLAVSAAGGLACAAQPNIDSVSCLSLPTDPTANVTSFTLPGLPSGSAPAAVKVLDANDVVVFGRGNNTLYQYRIANGVATLVNHVQIADFTPADTNYWQQYPATGGWEIVALGTGPTPQLAVMGQVANNNGTVSQRAAVVNAVVVDPAGGFNDYSLGSYLDLPAGTVHIATDPTNQAVVAEYPDFTGSSPITRFERIYVGTGNSTLLQFTSTLVPGAGFLVTLDGSHIAIFVNGQADFEPNQ